MRLWLSRTNLEVELGIAGFPGILHPRGDLSCRLAGAMARCSAPSMLKSIRSLLRHRPTPSKSSVPEGQRVYAIGDVHGRRDLFDQLIDLIEDDDASRPPARTTIVLLGDLIDRGPDSAGVIDAAIALAGRRDVRSLAGNHEEMFLDSFEKIATLRHFLRYGGKETVLSYPLAPEQYERMSHEEIQAALPRLVPARHLAYLRAMEDHITIGDYLFVHAGVRPGVDLAEQRSSDLRWIREPFLDHAGDHGAIVIHGHTITEEVVQRRNRIGIDTGAYLSGRLTAIGLERTERWFLNTSTPVTGGQPMTGTRSYA